jgi:hypothetical protein
MEASMSGIVRSLFTQFEGQAGGRGISLSLFALRAGGSIPGVEIRPFSELRSMRVVSW